jgi:hypothetical protein
MAACHLRPHQKMREIHDTKRVLQEALAKYLVKKIVAGEKVDYTFAEVLNASLGRMERVARLEHKGFDWEKLLAELKKYFDVERVEGIQFPWAPLCCNAQIGFVLRSRTNDDGVFG